MSVHAASCCAIAPTTALAILFTVLAVAMVMAYRCSVAARYHIRMLLFYASIFVAGFFAMFGSIPTFFLNQGTLVPWTLQKWICWLWLDLQIEVRGEKRVATQASQVLVSNHQSSLDVLVMAHLCPPRCAVMVKASLQWVPGFNIAAWLSNTIFVKRHSREAAHKAMEEAAEKVVKNRLKLWVFPEGTRHHGHGMLPFKRGAFNVAVQAHAPIVPVVISDLAPFYSKTHRYFHPRGLVICQVMEPISTAGLTVDDVPKLCEQVRDSMLKVYEEISEEARQRFNSQQEKPNENANEKKAMKKSQ